jgi:hypothetical protein
MQAKPFDYTIIRRSLSTETLRGTFPRGWSQQDLLQRLRAPLGGRMNYFSSEKGEFEYQRFTD